MSGSVQCLKKDRFEVPDTSHARPGSEYGAGIVKWKQDTYSDPADARKYTVWELFNPAMGKSPALVATITANFRLGSFTLRIADLSGGHYERKEFSQTTVENVMGYAENVLTGKGVDLRQPAAPQAVE